MGFLDNIGIGIYFIIFFGKIIEVTVATLRMVLINRGERVKGTIIAFFDILLWLVITGTVLDGFQEDPLRMLVFALAFAVGNYLGSWFEEKLAFGLSSIEIIVPDLKKSQQLANTFRDRGYGVTVLKGDGKKGEIDLLILYLKRKQIDNAKKIIEENYPKAVVVINDSRKIKGAYSSIK